MASTIVWSERAVEDLESIAAFIALDSEVYAAAVVRDTLYKTNKLVDHPFLGRTVPEFADPSIRELFAYSYRIVYRAADDVVTIAAVVHGRRILEMELLP